MVCSRKQRGHWNGSSNSRTDYKSVCVSACMCGYVCVYANSVAIYSSTRTCNTVRIREETLYVDLDEETFLKQVLVFGMLYINRVKLVHPDIKIVHLFRRIRILL